jgi:hypothetical protein
MSRKARQLSSTKIYHVMIRDNRKENRPLYLGEMK